MNLEQIQEEQQEGSEHHQDSSDDDDDQSCSDSSNNKLIVKSRNAHKVKYSTCEDGVGKNDATNKDNQTKQS